MEQGTDGLILNGSSNVYGNKWGFSFFPPNLYPFHEVKKQKKKKRITPGFSFRVTVEKVLRKELKGFPVQTICLCPYK